MAQPFSVPTDNRGMIPPGTREWTGEVQALAFTDTVTAATKITVPGKWLYFWATEACHITLGDAYISAAHATNKNRCFPIPSGKDGAGWCGPFYVPAEFDSKHDGSGDLYVRAVRNSTNGTLYISAAFRSAGLTPGAAGSTTSTTTTTTTTTSTTTTTTTTTTTSTTT